MDLIQLYLASQHVEQAIQASDLNNVVNDYREALAGDGDVKNAEAQLLASTSNYLDRVGGFGPDELAVVERLRLSRLGSPSFWFDLTSPSCSHEKQQAQLAGVSILLSFVDEQLSGLLGLVSNEAIAHSTLQSDDPTVIVLHVADAHELASAPDRLARIIDGLDMVYEGCALLAGTQRDALRLVSVSGSPHRTLVFQGDKEPATATRRIVRSLTEWFTSGHLTAGEPVDDVCENLPFIHSIDDLYHVGALSAGFADQIRRTTLAGTIMLAEAGVELSEYSPIAVPVHEDENLPDEHDNRVEDDFSNYRRKSLAADDRRRKGHDIELPSAEAGNQPDEMEEFIEQLNNPEDK